MQINTLAQQGRQYLYDLYSNPEKKDFLVLKIKEYINVNNQSYSRFKPEQKISLFTNFVDQLPLDSDEQKKAIKIYLLRKQTKEIIIDDFMIDDEGANLDHLTSKLKEANLNYFTQINKRICKITRNSFISQDTKSEKKINQLSQQLNELMEPLQWHKSRLTNFSAHLTNLLSTTIENVNRYEFKSERAKEVGKKIVDELSNILNHISSKTLEAPDAIFLEKKDLINFFPHEIYSILKEIVTAYKSLDSLKVPLLNLSTEIERLKAQIAELRGVAPEEAAAAASSSSSSSQPAAEEVNNEEASSTSQSQNIPIEETPSPSLPIEEPQIPVEQPQNPISAPAQSPSSLDETINSLTEEESQASTPISDTEYQIPDEDRTDLITIEYDDSVQSGSNEPTKTDSTLEGPVAFKEKAFFENKRQTTTEKSKPKSRFRMISQALSTIYSMITSFFRRLFGMSKNSKI